jgi:DNA-binding transcriptional MerR regulator
MGKPSYSLTDLSDMTGIEPRTIRSYFERGLLRGADRLGPGASYGPYHLDRLRVIRRLRDYQDLPLDKIRLLLHSLRESQIQGIASGRLTIGGIVDTDISAPGMSRRGEKASEDLASARPEEEESERIDAYPMRPEGRVASRPLQAFLSHRSGKLPESETDVPGEEEMRRPLASVLNWLASVTGVRRARSASRATWHEIEITPDVYLRVRAGHDPAQLDDYEQLAGQLRQILLGGTVPPEHEPPVSRGKPRA